MVVRGGVEPKKLKTYLSMFEDGTREGFLLMYHSQHSLHDTYHRKFQKNRCYRFWGVVRDAICLFTIFPYKHLKLALIMRSGRSIRE